MQLQLKRSRATFLELREATEDEIQKEGFELEHRTLFGENDNLEFTVEFRLQLTVGNTHRLTAQYASLFRTDSPFGNDFEESAFVRVNAPAIAFPFIRSYVAHITLIAGFESVILPTVNFKVSSGDLIPFQRSNID